MSKITYTIQTKIFTDTHAEDLEKSINEWLKDNNVKIIDIHTAVYPMYDMYQQRAPECNYWEQYITTIIYHDETTRS